MMNTQYEEIPSISSALKQLLKGMIEPKPSKRFSLEQIKKHVWIRAMLY